LLLQRLDNQEFILKALHMGEEIPSKWTIAGQAACLPLGLAGIAILLSYMGHELAAIAARWQSAGADETFYGGLPIIQPILFQILQIAFVIICMPLLFNLKSFRAPKLGWCLLAIALGLLLAVWLNSDVRTFLQKLITDKSWPTAQEPPTDFIFLFQSPFLHAALWMIEGALLAPVAESLLYRGMLFKLAEPIGWLRTCVLSWVVLVLAYSFNTGVDGMLFAAQSGLIYVALRQVTGRLIYPVICHAVFGLVAVGASLYTVLGVALP
jgi:membrane protease YdiL (CAAX protease family)